VGRVLAARAAGAQAAALVAAERADSAERPRERIKAEPPEARTRPAEQAQMPQVAQAASRARVEPPRRAAARAARPVDRAEPQRRVVARVAVAAPPGASLGYGTTWCWLRSARLDFACVGGSRPAVSGQDVSINGPVLKVINPTCGRAFGSAPEDPSNLWTGLHPSEQDRPHLRCDAAATRFATM